MRMQRLRALDERNSKKSVARQEKKHTNQTVLGAMSDVFESLH